ncbi:MAG: hypothetical protein DRJ26_01525, partial [Candidatus Methanomethylicota archaeon]
AKELINDKEKLKKVTTKRGTIDPDLIMMEYTDLTFSEAKRVKKLVEPLIKSTFSRRSDRVVILPLVDSLKKEVDKQMDAILSVDATKGNRVIKVEGFAITPTVKEGWILKVSDDLIDIYERVTGKQVAVVPITMQDITPYGTGIYHINSMMQPWLMTSAPVVGVAITAKLPVAGCATGATYITSLEAATRFCIEVAKDYTSGKCKFYDESEFRKIIEIFGGMEKLRKLPTRRS